MLGQYSEPFFFHKLTTTKTLDAFMWSKFNAPHEDFVVLWVSGHQARWALGTSARLPGVYPSLQERVRSTRSLSTPPAPSSMLLPAMQYACGTSASKFKCRLPFYFYKPFRWNRFNLPFPPSFSGLCPLASWRAIWDLSCASLWTN